MLKQTEGTRNLTNNICKQRLSAPGFLHSYVAVEFLQSVLSCIMVHNQDALFHVRPLGSLEDCYRST